MKTRRSLALLSLLVLVSPMTILWKIIVIAPAVTYLLLDWEDFSWHFERR